MVSHGFRKAVRQITPFSQLIALIIIALFFTPILQVVSAQNAPDPWVARPIYVNGVGLDPNNPPSITLGETLRIEVGGIIRNFAAEEAYLTISFPDLTSTSSYVSITGGTAPNKNRYPPGYNGYGCYGGCRVTFSYWVVEGWATPWPRDSLYNLLVAVKPERVGDFKVHVKFVARAGNTWYADPTTNGQAKYQPPGRVVLDQQQREYVYEFTVKVNPPPGNLVVNVHNIPGYPLPAMGGNIMVDLYRGNYESYITSRSVSFSGGESFKSVSFANLPQGSYTIEVYQAPSRSIADREFWGAGAVQVTGGQTTTHDFYRHTQVVSEVRPRGPECSIVVGQELRPIVTVRNYDTASKETRVRLIIDRDRTTPYDYDRTTDPITIPSNSQRDFTLPPFQPSQQGQYYYYVVAEGLYGPPQSQQYLVTDQWYWVEACNVRQEQISLSVQPTSWSPTVQAGSSASQAFTVSVSGGTARGVTVSMVSGPSWLTINPTNLGDIASGQSKTFTVTASPPSGTSGQFSYRIRVSGSNTEPVEIQGTINIQQQQQQDIIPPTVRVLAPNGGETLTVGQTFRIRWEASDNVGVSHVHIWLFLGGSQVAVIATNHPNTGYLDWTVPNRPGTGYRIRIAAVDGAGNAGVDDSDGTFNIQQQPSAGLVVDVWTSSGGQGVGNLDGGIFRVGEYITIYISVSADADRVLYRLVRPDGTVVTIHDGPLNAGIYRDQGQIGPPPGPRRIMVDAWKGGLTASDEVEYTAYMDVKFRGQVVGFNAVFPVVEVLEVIEDPYNYLRRGMRIVVSIQDYRTECGGPGRSDEVRLGDEVEVYGRMFYPDSADLYCSYHYLRKVEQSVVTITRTLTTTLTRYQTITSTYTQYDLSTVTDRVTVTRYGTVTEYVTVGRTSYTTTYVYVSTTSTRWITKTVTTTGLTWSSSSQDLVSVIALTLSGVLAVSVFRRLRWR